MTKLLALIGVSLFAYFYINNALTGGTDDAGTDNRALDASTNF